MRRRVIQYFLIPSILIFSDILLMFLGHFSGTTGNDYSLSAFGKYLSELQFSDLLPALVIAAVVVVLVELAIRYNGK